MNTIRHIICAVLCLLCAFCIALGGSLLHLVLNMDGIVPGSESPVNGNILFISIVGIIQTLFGFACLCGALLAVRRFNSFICKIALFVYVFAILLAYVFECIMG